MTVEARKSGDQALVVYFRARALISGAVAAVFGAVAAYFASVDAPRLWAQLFSRALPLSAGAILIGLATAAALLLGYYRAARLCFAAEITCILGAWAVAQMPYLIPPDLTVENSAAPPATQIATVITSALGLPIILTSLWYLYHVFKGSYGRPRVTASDYIASLQASEGQSAPSSASPGDDALSRPLGQDGRRSARPGESLPHHTPGNGQHPWPSRKPSARPTAPDRPADTEGHAQAARGERDEPTAPPNAHRAAMLEASSLYPRAQRRMQVLLALGATAVSATLGAILGRRRGDHPPRHRS
jgi:hypothetical protein